MGVTRRGRYAAVAGGLLGVAQACQALEHQEQALYLSVLLGFAVVIGVLAAVRLWWAGCFESRLTLAAVAGLTLAGEGLVTLIGLPGNHYPTTEVGLSPAATMAVLAAAVALGLLYCDRRFTSPQKDAYR